MEGEAAASAASAGAGALPQQAAVDFDVDLRNLRTQFGEQIKAFGLRTEKKIEFLRDLLAFFAKQGEIETQQAQSLDKLIERHQKARHYFLQKKTGEEDASAAGESSADHPPNGSLADVWTTLLEQSRKKAAGRLALTQTLMTDLRARIEHLERETAATSERSVRYGKGLQEDFNKLLKQVEERLRDYHLYQTQLTKLEDKFDKAMKQGDVKRGGKTKEKLGLAERKAMLARNDYILALAASNAFKQRYFAVEMENVVDVLDQNYHECLRQVLQLFHQLNDQFDTASLAMSEKIFTASSALDPVVEKTKFFGDHQHAFLSLRPFDFSRCQGDKVSSIQFQPDMEAQLKEQYAALESSVVSATQKIRETMVAMAASRGSKTSIAPAAKGKGDDGSSRPVEAAVSHAEAVGRLSKLHCQRTSDLAQLRLLAEALGSKCTPMANPSDLTDEVTLSASSGTTDAGTHASSVPAPFGSSSVSPPSTVAVGTKHKRSASMEASSLVNPVTHEPVAEAPKSHSVASATSGGAAPVRTNTMDPASTAAAAVTVATTTATAAANTSSTEPQKQAGATAVKKAPPPPIKRRGITDSAPESASGSAAALKTEPAAPVAVSSLRENVAASSGLVSSGSFSGTGSGSGAATNGGSGTISPPAPAAVAPKQARPKPAVVEPVYYKFGSALEQVYNHTGEDVPLAVSACVGFLERVGLREEGLFRVPGSSNEVDEMKMKLEQGKNPFVGTARPANPEAAATCLKLYLRELAEPVIPRSLYADFVKSGRQVDLNARVNELKIAVHEKLPVAHRELLKLLLPFLQAVAQHASTNKMTTSNLALVFGPTLLPAPRDDMAAMLRDSTAVNNVMTTMIEAADRIFPELAVERAAAAAAAAASQPSNKDSSAAGAGTAAGASAAGSGAPASVVDGAAKDEGAAELESEDEEEEEELVEIGRVRARHDYTERIPTELSFKAGDIIVIFKNFGKDWSLGCTVQDPSQRKFVANAYVDPWHPTATDALKLGADAREESSS